MEPNDPVTAPVIGRRPYHTTWSELVRLFGQNDHGIRWLLSNEGITWVRGHVTEDSPVWRAMMSARALGAAD